MVNGIFFNLDGTLTERTRGFDKIYGEAVDSSGLKIIEDSYQEYQEKFFKYFRSSYVFPRRQAIEELLKEKDYFSDERVEEFVKGWEEAESDSFVLKEGVKEVLEDLSENNVLGIISNGTGRLQRMKLEKLGISDYFESVIISSEVGFKKPEPGIFEAAKSSLSVDRFFIVSNLPKSDILGGKKNGLKPVWLDKSEKSIEGVDKLQDIKGLVSFFEQS